MALAGQDDKIAGTSSLERRADRLGAISPESLADVAVRMTILGGEVAFEAR